MTLETWQTTLDEYFSAVTSQRLTNQTSHPTFALKHGLQANDREQLQQDVRRAFANGAPAGEPFLPWAVYGAEFGYRYSGEEYLQTFEDELPGWEGRHRDDLRLAFIRFRQAYGGA